jgi:hypothetical protein
MRTIRIEASQLPPVECSPNWRGHWVKRYKAGQIFKKAVHYSCLEQNHSKPLKEPTLNLTFVVAQERTRDEDNWRARFKPGQDALVDAGVITKDDVKHLKIGYIKFVVDKKLAPRSIIELRGK